MGNLCGSPARLAHFSSTQFPETVKEQISSPSAQPSSKADQFISRKSSNSLTSFTFNDLKAATKNFRPESILGEGGFGCVFKGWVDEHTFAPTKSGSGLAVAVKKLRIESLQGHKEWLAEVNYLGQLRHENLVKLIGYCSESENRLLVYEHMSKGSLENHLFQKAVQPISWTTRMTIAVDVARGLSFLHCLDANVIYRDLKAANILLDSNFNAKLSDFGLARDGPTGDNTHVSTEFAAKAAESRHLPRGGKGSLAVSWSRSRGGDSDPVCLGVARSVTSDDGAEYDMTLAEFKINRKRLKSQRRKEAKMKRSFSSYRRKKMREAGVDQILDKVVSPTHEEAEGSRLVVEEEGEVSEDGNQITKSSKSGSDKEALELSKKREEAILTYQVARSLGLEGLAPDEEMVQHLMELV